MYNQPQLSPSYDLRDQRVQHLSDKYGVSRQRVVIVLQLTGNNVAIAEALLRKERFVR
jgi:hypothetical protein